jgi:hypothetical protein
MLMVTSTPTVNVLAKVFAIEQLVNVNVLMVMKEKAAREVVALMIALVTVLVSTLKIFLSVLSGQYQMVLKNSLKNTQVKWITMDGIRVKPEGVYVILNMPIVIVPRECVLMELMFWTLVKTFLIKRNTKFKMLSSSLTTRIMFLMRAKHLLLNLLPD